ncbi:MAG: hypothetical protein ABI361_02915 [Nitrososphaera sp.]|jgi:hypothetical protein
MPRYLGVMILAIAIMAIAYVGRDHPGTLLQDSVSYFSSIGASAATSSLTDKPDGSLPNRFDQGQVKQYVQEKFTQGLGQGAAGEDTVSQAIASDSAVLSATADNTTSADQSLLSSLTGTAGSPPNAQDQPAINSYIVQKFHEGEASGSAGARHSLN